MAGARQEIDQPIPSNDQANLLRVSGFFGIDADSPAMAYLVGEDSEQLQRVISTPMGQLQEESGLHAASLAAEVDQLTRYFELKLGANLLSPKIMYRWLMTGSMETSEGPKPPIEVLSFSYREAIKRDVEESEKHVRTLEMLEEFLG